MTTELEQEFFKVFGIEPKKQGYCDWQSDCPYSDIKCGDDCPYWKYENELKYPEITDRKLLEMICILQKFKNILFDNLYFEKIEDLKNEVLSQIYKCKLNLHEFNAERLKHQIQQLFKEEE